MDISGQYCVDYLRIIIIILLITIIFIVFIITFITIIIICLRTCLLFTDYVLSLNMDGLHQQTKQHLSVLSQLNNKTSTYTYHTNGSNK